MTKQRDDYDNPWKMAIAIHFESLLAFFFPEIHQNIDWNKPYEFLDNNFKLEIESYKEENKMPYVTSFERTAREDDIIMILETRFNADHNKLIKILETIDDDQQLRFLLKQAITINSVADFSELVKSLDLKKDDL